MGVWVVPVAVAMRRRGWGVIAGNSASKSQESTRWPATKSEPGDDLLYRYFMSSISEATSTTCNLEYYVVVT